MTSCNTRTAQVNDPRLEAVDDHINDSIMMTQGGFHQPHQPQLYLT